MNIKKPPPRRSGPARLTELQISRPWRADVGARPYSELANVTEDHVVGTPHRMHYKLKARTTDGQSSHKTGKDRRIMLLDEMELFTCQQMLAAPTGAGIPLF